MPANARWVIPNYEPEQVVLLSNALHVASPLAKILVRRGLADPADARRFLKPSLDELNDPAAMLDMLPAVDRLLRAIRDSELILIYGDYDVDGTTSVVILSKAIELAGGRAIWHVPHRLRDGYGMRPEVVERAAAEGVRLIVSVDTGIRARRVVERANELGIDVIITDHHLPEEALPPAIAVLNPNRPGCPYPEKGLCGAGVAFKLVEALMDRLSWPTEKTRRVTESFLKMTAIATVADVVPLSGENRVIVKHGLDGLSQVRNPGLRALLDVAGFSGSRVPTSRQVAFQIAPRLNAAGRMDTAQAVIELFLTSDTGRACELARRLHDQNAERQQVEAGIRETCEQLRVEESAAGLVYYSEEWHRGVLGIVASRLVERLHRPVFVLGLNPDDGTAQGSGRSIPRFHLLEALEAMPDLFLRFGGHKHAAGVTLDACRIPEFRERFQGYAAGRLGPEDLRPELEIDGVLDFREIDTRAAEEVFALAPFGCGNPAPLFAALNVEVAGPAMPWNGKHLRVVLRQNGRSLALKAWNFAERAAELEPGGRVDVVFSLEEDPYASARGYPGWMPVLRDVRSAVTSARTASA
ncbi:MAG: single-stranded-DNA-specific exonuclease RecJ [Acidobacteriia bacterium]|nr:single-stranded-DNA-specific exonuclease RecJ [Terriglobia bacterium]